MTTVNWLMIFKEIIDVYFENHKKYLNTFCGPNAELLNMKAGGTHSYYWALSG
jgi:hypothetical protein